MPSANSPGLCGNERMPTAAELTEHLKTAATRLGFVLAGTCAAVEPAGVNRLYEWLSRGFAGEMNYIDERRAAYQHPSGVLPGVKNLLLLAFPYRTSEPQTLAAGSGRISRYAWGDADYHDVIHDRLRQLVAELKQHVPSASARGVVDSAPLLEREFAQLAGLGWIGKHTLLLNRTHGSYFFLAAILTDQELTSDPSFTADHCGSCRACLEACPTQAFPQPYVLDATRCISYLTIELRGPIPHELRPGIGDWLFGCDVCQDVCPWNNRSPATELSEFQPRANSNPVDLAALLELDDAAFRERFRNTPLWRAKRRGILRNAAIVLGNQRAVAAIPALISGLHDSEPLIRGAAAWALGRIGTSPAREALRTRERVEEDDEVRTEIEQALAEMGC